MNLGRLLQGIAPVAGAAGNVVLGIKKDRDDSREQAVRAALAQRQQQHQDLMDSIATERAPLDRSHIQAETNALTQPRPITPPQVLSPGQGVRNAAGGYDVPLPAREPAQPTPRFSTYQDTDPASGKPRTMRLNTLSGETAPIGGGRGVGGGGLSGNAQNMQARLLGAVSEGRLADERMSAFEKAHLKDGKLDVGTLEDVGAGLNTGLAGSHNPVSIIMGRAAGGIMNAAGKGDLVQYQRDARLTARAEQLMSARGGSEAMASDNAFLAQGAANAPESTVRAAQKSRRALFGKLGAVMQTLTPEQTQKLNAGLEALHQMDPEFDKKSPIEQTLDAIDKSGLANDIRNAAAGTVPGTVAHSSADPEFDALMAKHRKRP